MIEIALNLTGMESRWLDDDRMRAGDSSRSARGLGSGERALGYQQQPEDAPGPPGDLYLSHIAPSASTKRMIYTLVWKTCTVWSRVPLSVPATDCGSFGNFCHD